MSPTVFIKKTILSTLLTLIAIALIVIAVDPFTRYHAPWFGLTTVETDERCAAIGIARNLDYDTALVGSSMSENFNYKWFEDGVFGTRCVKIPLQGAHYCDYEPVIKEVLDHKGTKNVVFSLDNYLLTDDFYANTCSIEDYYIKRPGLSDVHYLFNKSVFFDYLPKFIATNIHEHFNNENAYVWSDDYEYSKYAARLAYMSSRVLVKQDEKIFSEYFENADAAIDPLTGLIKAHPDVTFHIYIPPYSILFWDDTVLRGNATAIICVQEREFRKLLECDNVRLYYFQDDTDIVTDLSNYRDYSHYKQDINYYMYEAMRDKTHEMTLENYFDKLLKMYDFINAYDYEQCFH